MRRVDVTVVGAGPAGLAAAIALRRLGIGRVLVLEREAAAGGIPRHTAHPGFGMRDLRRVLSGPAYAARYVRAAARAGVEVCTAASVTGWSGPTTLAVSAPDGVYDVHAAAVLLATGCRERPRTARLVAGSRPLGVYTTGTVQQLVYLHRQRVGRRALVVGAEHVSFSAVQTLAHGGTATVALVTEHARDQTYAPLRWVTTTLRRVPVLTGTRVTAIRGRHRVEAVELTELTTGAARTLACDTVVFTGDWIPEHELVRRAGLGFDPGTRGPLVDAAGRTSVPGVFAAGNLVHAAETADVAALGGRHVAAAIAAYLVAPDWPPAPVRLLCEPPLVWVTPGVFHPGAGWPARERFVLRIAGPAVGALAVRQGERRLWRGSVRRLVANRSIALPAAALASTDPAGGPVTIGVEQ